MLGLSPSAQVQLLGDIFQRHLGGWVKGQRPTFISMAEIEVSIFVEHRKAQAEDLGKGVTDWLRYPPRFTVSKS